MKTEVNISTLSLQHPRNLPNETNNKATLMYASILITKICIKRQNRHIEFSVYLVLNFIKPPRNDSGTPSINKHQNKLFNSKNFQK